VKAARTTILVAALMCGAAGAPAQQRPASPVADVLRQARQALDNLDYGAAATLARSVLSSTAPVGRAERVEALLVMAAALYPEEPRARHPDSAVVYLRRYVSSEPDGTIPSAISWRGLDSLLEQVRRTTFAAAARPPAVDTLTGTGGTVAIPVVATRPARFHLSFGSGRQPTRQVEIDSAGPATSATLRLRLFDGDRPLASSGAWTVVMTAIASGSPDTIAQRLSATVDAPALELVPVPATMDSSELRSEWKRPSRGLGIAIGAGLGGAAIVMTQALRAPDPVGSAVKADSRAWLVAGGFALGGIVGALLDKGHPDASGVAHNNQVRAEFARRVADARRENDRRRQTYRATITIEEATP
jgi:hypothetical protein